MLVAMPAFARSPFPDITRDDVSTDVSTYYGTDDSHQVWVTSVVNLSTARDEGFILGLLCDNNYVSAQSLYFWGRINGETDELFTPEDSDDFVIGTTFLINTGSEHLNFYLGEEVVKFTSLRDEYGNIIMDHTYTGIGTNWVSDDVLVDVGAWWNLDNDFRFTASCEFTPIDEIIIMPTAWVMVDEDVNDGQPWGWWRLTVNHPINEDVELSVFYEDSQYTDAIFMFGIRTEL
jgi:hypothetical protein